MLENVYNKMLGEDLFTNLSELIKFPTPGAQRKIPQFHSHQHSSQCLFHIITSFGAGKLSGTVY